MYNDMYSDMYSSGYSIHHSALSSIMWYTYNIEPQLTCESEIEMSFHLHHLKKMSVLYQYHSDQIVH